MKRPSTGSVLAAIALFIVIGGTATAAGLINGKKIKPGTVTAKQIKNKTITKAKLNPSTISALKGAQGPQGAAGNPGATGATGPAGAVTPLHAELNYKTTEDYQPIVSLDLPAGTYLLMAKANMTSNYNGGNNYLSCSIWKNDTEAVDEASTDAAFNKTVNLSMMAVDTFGGKVDVRCFGDTGASNVSNVKLIATPVAG